MILNGDWKLAKQNRTRKLSFLDQYPKHKNISIKNPLKKQKTSLQKQKITKQPSQESFSTIAFSSPIKEKRSRLLSIQNDFIVAAQRRVILLDERKFLIKEKIKLKVKQQIQEVLKRMQSTTSQQKNLSLNAQYVNKQLIEVKIQGQSAKRSLRNSLSCKSQFQRQQKNTNNIRKKIVSQIKQYKKDNKMMRSDLIHLKKFNTESIGSKSTRFRDLSPKKFPRHIQSAMDGYSDFQKKQSFKIQPWKFIQDF